MQLFLSEKIVLDYYFYDGAILVENNGKILEVLSRNDAKSIIRDYEDIQIIDVGNYVIMPGIIDSHVHINEPGRTDWEGFETATKAAAAGGITTIVDMPLNSIPPTTTVENLKTKVNATMGKLHVDVAFWGGVVPGNGDELVGMVKAGVVGFKCFLCPSGVDEFNHVDFDDVEKALEKLEHTNSVLAFHAELEEEVPLTISNGDPTCYETFLETRPPSMEARAIEKVIELATKYNVRTHIVHLSAATAVPMLEKAKANNPKISVETCHHYLSLSSETISKGCTQFKCCPPIRNKENQDILWEALRRNIISMVVSDHSPSTPDLKLINVEKDRGNFLKAWGGISSLQFALSIFWTESRQRGFTIFDVNKYMSRATGQLVGLHNRKGKIMRNYDADFVVWDPLTSIIIKENMIQHKNKITPYLERELTGKVIKTIVRGRVVYDHQEGFSLPQGNALVNKEIFQ